MKNWQKQHECLLDRLNILAGRKVQQFDRDTAHLGGRALRQARKLNAANSQAVKNYYRGTPWREP